MPVGRLLPAQHAVDLRPDQQFDLRGVRPAFDEQVEEVGLAVHRAHHPGLTQPLGRLRAVAQPLDPAERLPFLARLRLAFLLGIRGLGRVERRPQDPQRHPVGIDRYFLVRPYLPLREFAEHPNKSLMCTSRGCRFGTHPAGEMTGCLRLYDFRNN